MSTLSESEDERIRALLKGLYVHTVCGGVRGRVEYLYSRCGCEVNVGRWQSCRCESEPVRWPGVDVSSKVDLCVLCARSTAGGTGRFSWIVCGTCRSVVKAASAELGVRPLIPMGRHSIMNGALAPLRGDAAQIDAGQKALVASLRSVGGLYEWFSEEFRRVLAEREWAAEHIELDVWLQRAGRGVSASAAALARLTGQPITSLAFYKAMTARQRVPRQALTTAAVASRLV